MSVVAIKEYPVEIKDTVDKFHGNQLVYVGWDQHLFFCAPFCFPLPPAMPFRDLVEKVMPPAFGAHPEFAQIDWTKAQWLKSGQPFTPAFDRSLAENGIGHKDALRFRTPGLNGIKGSAS